MNILLCPRHHVNFYTRNHNKTTILSSDIAYVDDAFVFVPVVSREATHSIFCYLCYICGGMFASTDLIFLTLDSLTMDNLKMYLNKGMT